MNHVDMNHIGGYAIIKTERRRNGLINIQRLQVGPIDFTSPRTHVS